MEKKNTTKNDQKSMRKLSVVRSIPKHVDKRLNEIGQGDWKKGLYVAVDAWDIQHKNPEIKLMNDVDILMTDLKLFYPDNHYKHFRNFPAFFRLFLKNGIPNTNFLKIEGEIGDDKE